MNIDWKKIKQNHLKAYELLEKYIKLKYGDFINIEYEKNKLTLYVHGESGSRYSVYDICYCDIESFFDKNELSIVVYYQNAVGQKMWCFKIEDHWFLKPIVHRYEAKEQAIYKAFEMFNEILKQI